MLWQHADVEAAPAPHRVMLQGSVLTEPRFELEFQTYCAQAGASEAWTTDILTREKVNVMESCTELLVSEDSFASNREAR